MSVAMLVLVRRAVISWFGGRGGWFETGIMCVVLIPAQIGLAASGFFKKKMARTMAAAAGLVYPMAAALVGGFLWSLLCFA